MIYILCTISDVFFATQSELFQGLNAAVVLNCPRKIYQTTWTNF